MAEIKCPHCGQPMDATGSICRSCAGKTLARALVNVGAYYADLDNLRTGQTRYGAASGTRSTSARLGCDPRFVMGGVGLLAISVTRTAVTTWVRYVLDHVPPVIGPACYLACLHVSCSAVRKTRPPRDNVPACCEYLGRWVDWFRVSNVGLEILLDVLACERSLRTLVDRPAERWYAGVCSARLSDDAICQQELYAKTEQGTITCRACETVHDVHDRRAWLLAAAEDYELTAQELARAVSVLDDRYDGTEKTLASRIRKWAERNQLTPIRHDVMVADSVQVRRPLYRLGDVLDLLATDLRTAESRRAIRAS